MKQFIVISSFLHVTAVILLTFFNLGAFFKQPEIKQQETIQIEFLDKLPINKTLTEAVFSKKVKPTPPTKDTEKTTPPPKPAPGIKTKVAPQKAEEKKETPTPKKEEVKKTAPPLPKVAEKKAPPQAPKPKEATKPASTPQAPTPEKKQSVGIEKQKQEVESVDALLNTLLPDVGGKRDEKDEKLKEVYRNEMPEYLESSAVQAIRSQIEAVWSYNPTEGINFYLTLKIDPTGKILNVILSGTSNQNTLQKAAAEAAYRSTLKLSQFELDPTIFKPEYYQSGWQEIELHFQPRH
jgi:hypothetical protein